MNNADYEKQRGRLMNGALLVGLAAAAVGLLGLLFDADQFFRSYLWSYLVWWEVSVGCLGIALLYQLVGGRWGFLARPFVDAGVRTLPLMALLFVPIAVGLGSIYPWTAEGYFDGNPHAHNKARWLDEGLFLLRAILYFGVWLAFCWLVARRAPRRDSVRHPDHETGMGKLAAVGLALTTLAVSQAAMDWAMSVDPHFQSTIYGGLFAIGGMMTGMAVVTAGTCWYFAPLMPEPADLPEDQWDQEHPVAPLLNDLGNLLMAFLLVFTYFHFSQFLIIWSGNLPEEAAWYVRRQTGWWEPLGVVLVALQWVVPFACLLSRDIKRNPRRLGFVAAWILLMHIPVIYWTVMPAYGAHETTAHDGAVLPSWLDPVLVVAIGGLWIATFAWLLGSRGIPVVPLSESHDSAKPDEATVH